MSRALVVLRPEPGNSQTARAIEDAGASAIRLPLFVVRPLSWPAPTREHDALILTSANAMRHGGAQLATLTDLPVYAVGATTATSAQVMGFTVAHIGTSGADALLEQARADGVARALHLTGKHHRLTTTPPIVEIREVYASEASPVDRHAAGVLEGSVALIHSPRAARALADLASENGLDRSAIAIAAISESAAKAAGTGWGAIAVSQTTDDKGVIAAARTLAD